MSKKTMKAPVRDARLYNTETIDKKVEELENRLFSDKNSHILENLSRINEYSDYDHYTDTALRIICSFDMHALTFREFLAMVDDIYDENLSEPRSGGEIVRALEQFYMMMVDKTAIESRADNLLTTLPEDDGWKSRLDRELAKYMAKSPETTPVRLDESFYGWEDYFLQRKETQEFIGLFNIYEDSHVEFAGTFASSDYHEIAVTADAVYASGRSRLVRLKKSMGELMIILSE